MKTILSNKVFMALCVIAAVPLLLLQPACDKHNQPISSNPGDTTIMPLMPYSPNPVDGALDIGDNCTISWQCNNPDEDTIEYNIFMGIDSLVPIQRFYPAKGYNIPWGKQSAAKRILLQIYQMQSAYRNQYRSYCLNGTMANRTYCDNFRRINVIIDSTDYYFYSICATRNTFHCCATANIDNDATIDTWVIDQTGMLQQTISDFRDCEPFEFHPGTTYSWRVLVLSNADRDSTWGPIWHFTTTNDIIPPHYDMGTPQFPIPSDYSIGVTCSTIFYWYCVSPANDSLTYDLFLSPGDCDPQLYIRRLTISQTYLNWGAQFWVQPSLMRIYQGEQYFKTHGWDSCYVFNGISSTNEDDNFYMLGVHIDLIDFYNYAITASCDTFTCTATADIDADPEIDTWIIDQTGVIRHVVSDSDIPFTPGQLYSWRVVAHDVQGHQYAGPIWHFTTAE
jgi:hypothetical protein